MTRSDNSKSLQELILLVQTEKKRFGGFQNKEQMSLHKDNAKRLFQKYYSLVYPGSLYPAGFNVQIEDAAYPDNKPMIQASLQVGDLQLKRVVQGYQLHRCTKKFIKDLQESMMIYFVQHNLEAIERTIGLLEENQAKLKQAKDLKVYHDKLAQGYQDYTTFSVQTIFNGVDLYIDKVPSSWPSVVSLDTEGYDADLIQVATNETTVYFYRNKELIQEMLNDKSIKKIVFAGGSEKYHFPEIQNVYDLQNKTRLPLVSLEDTIKEVFGYRLVKDKSLHSRESWSTNPLSKEQTEYAAADALWIYRIYCLYKNQFN